MTLSILFGPKYAQGQIVSPEFGTVSFDTVTVEDHQYSAIATAFPTEFGPIISDHILREPEIVNITGIVSDTPLTIFPSPNRSVTAFNKLVELYERRQIITLITGIKVYQNMCITKLNVPRTIRTGQTLTFDLTFQKILLVDSVQVVFDQGNIFEGVVDDTPRQIVAENTSYPYLQLDPAFSLKDQSETEVNVGVQPLTAVPPAMLPNVFISAALLGGL